MACLSHLLPRRKETHHMEVIEGLHTFPPKGGGNCSQSPSFQGPVPLDWELPMIATAPFCL